MNTRNLLIGCVTVIAVVALLVILGIVLHGQAVAR